jgi:hypothetical protein
MSIMSKKITATPSDQAYVQIRQVVKLFTSVTDNGDTDILRYVEVSFQTVASDFITEKPPAQQYFGVHKGCMDAGPYA